MKDIKVSSIETRVGFAAAISELHYRAPSAVAAANGLTAAGEGEGIYRLAHPRPQLLLALAEAERSGAVGEIVKLVVALDMQLRKEEASPERTMRNVSAIVLRYLDPWKGTCMGGRSVRFYTSSGDLISGMEEMEPGAHAVYGGGKGPVSLEIAWNTPAGSGITAPAKHSIRLSLTLLGYACQANGIPNMRALLASNGRHVFGQYVHLSSPGIGLGDLNARIKRELERAVRRLSS